jgi:hypothetical protein
MIKEIRCNEETKHESEKAKKKTLEKSQQQKNGMEFAVKRSDGL